MFAASAQPQIHDFGEVKRIVPFCMDRLRYSGKLVTMVNTAVVQAILRTLPSLR